MAKSIVINDILHNEILEYCKLNKTTVKDFSEKALKNALMIEKYGDAPFLKDKWIEKDDSQFKTEHITIDTGSSESVSVITAIDTEENKIIDQQEVVTTEDVDNFIEKVEMETKKEEQKPQQIPRARVRRIK